VPRSVAGRRHREIQWPRARQCLIFARRSATCESEGILTVLQFQSSSDCMSRQEAQHCFLSNAHNFTVPVTSGVLSRSAWLGIPVASTADCGLRTEEELNAHTTWRGGFRIGGSCRMFVDAEREAGH